MSAAKYLAVGSIIIDDIVYPDGRTSMAVLGGGGTHAAYGMVFAGERPGLVGLAGRDLPAEIRERLEGDFDTAGLMWSDLPTVRAWQIFEWDGKRNEVFRVEVLEPFMIDPLPERDELPYTSVTGLTLLREPEYVPAWRERYPEAMLLWEPTRAFMLSADRERYLSGIPQADIVSPNLHEAQTMYGLDDEVEIIRRMLADGAAIAALRMGELGSLVASRAEGRAWRIPAVEVAEVVDHTGAGNTYCGGFLVGWGRERDLALAGCYGAVAASFTLEAVGCARIPDDLEAEWGRRMAEARDGIGAVPL